MLTVGAFVAGGTFLEAARYVVPHSNFVSDGSRTTSQSMC